MLLITRVILGVFGLISIVAVADNEFYNFSIEELSDYDIFTAPVLQSHIHKKGEFMAAYHFTASDMDGLGDNDSKLSTRSVLQNYLVAPTSMTMEMHMVHLMYAVSNKTTIMSALHYMEMDMDHVTRMGGEFTTQSKGIGDTTLSLNHQIHTRVTERATIRYQLHAGVVLPTGSIDVKDQTPMGRVVLPYSMQLGSGSHWLRLGGGFNSVREKDASGVFAIAELPLDKNTEGYQLSPVIEISGWYQRSFSDRLSLGLSSDLEWSGSIDGSDDRLNANIVPTADTDNYGGTLFWGGANATYELSEALSVGISAKAPLWQYLKGPQLRKKNEFEIKLELTI